MCGERSNCLVYDSTNFRLQFLVLGLVGKGLSFLFFYLSYRSRDDCQISPRPQDHKDPDRVTALATPSADGGGAMIQCKLRDV